MNKLIGLNNKKSNFGNIMMVYYGDNREWV